MGRGRSGAGLNEMTMIESVRDIWNERFGFFGEE